ncbi:gamma-glutamylputrescine oxidase [Plasticicumulans lactativorans]|uniref:Gamma-glutamylputrescine oxidase n=1 Tax=Plasticicumulans lactativorans TaxID=1133106 RepID=A0A4R2LG40_9GAMM|nr:FAD-binding oxidoreductase [Plasticicumulans lactativorans]TCO81924.1 gamma-glutamylputrescine oxidase [Plasticicumulans lactativorans]
MSEHVKSWYAATARGAHPRPALEGTVDCDVCIVGAGFSGLSSALHLIDAGFRVVVLEAARIGFGATGRNGGQVVNSFSRDVDVVEARHGSAAARAIGGMIFEGGDIIRGLIARHGIDCDYRPGGIFAALNARQMRHLEAQQARWEAFGNRDLQLLDARAIRAHVASERYVGGLLDLRGGHLHPLNLALGEAAAVERQGGTIYEQSPVERIDFGPRPVAYTARGAVRSRYLVLAGNAYLGNLVPRLASRSMPCGTQVVATEPLGEARARALLPQDHCVEDCNFMLDYFRTTADHRLLFGGGTVYGARDPRDIEALIRPKLEKVFPQLAGVRFDHAWTGNFLLTLSRLPQFGSLGEHVFYIQGCSGHGVTLTHLAGRLIAERLGGDGTRFAAFAALPHLPFPGGRLLRVPLTALGATYYTLRDRLGL